MAEEKNKKPLPPIHQAINGGKPKKVTQLLDENPRCLVERDEEGTTPLERAVYRSTAKVVRALLDRGADPNSYWGKSSNPRVPNRAMLFVAIECDSPTVVQALIDYGADLSLTIGKTADSVLHWAIRMKAHKALQTLLEAGADVSLAADVESKRRGHMPLTFAAWMEDEKAVDMLADAGSDKTRALLKSLDGPVPSEKVVKRLLEAGADPNAKGKGFGDTALHRAACRSLPICEALIAAGADVNARDGVGMTPLSWSFQSYWEESEEKAVNRIEQTTKLLLEAGADPLIGKRLNGFPAHSAARRGFSGSLRRLLERMGDCDIRDVNEQTPLMAAVIARQMESCRVLIEHGADPDTPCQVYQQHVGYSTRTPREEAQRQEQFRSGLDFSVVRDAPRRAQTQSVESPDAGLEAGM